MRNVNVVVLTANLAADPAVRTTPSGALVGTLRVANSVRRKRGEQWVEKPSFFDVEVWGNQARACEQWLHKGSRVVVHGEIEIDEWQDHETGVRRLRPVVRQARVTFEGAPNTPARDAGEDGVEPGPLRPIAATADEIPF